MTTTLAEMARDFIGLDRVDPVHTLDGGTAERRRVYLDTTATSLMPRPVWDNVERYLEAASANSHTDAHRAGRDTTRAIEDSRDAIGKLVGYDPARDVVLFTSNGATGAINFLARALFPPELRCVIKRFPDAPPDSFVRTLGDAVGDRGRHTIDELMDRPLVVTTVMEHHSNLLPWIEAVGHHNIRAVHIDPDRGTLDMDHLRKILAGEGRRVRLVAVTAVSNVTGILNPVSEIARLAHEVGAEILVDGAQWVPHAPVRIRTAHPAEDLDYLVLSGHKMYAPGSRGAMIGRLSTIECRPCAADVGGGIVGYVSIDDFTLKNEVTAREEAGTPNIPGSIAMGLAAKMLIEVGMDRIAEAEDELTRYLVEQIADIPGVTVYGSTDLDAVPRAGVVSFNVDGMEHGLVATYLDNFHNIAVRNGCFCAQPYVMSLLHVNVEAAEKLKQQLILGDRSHVTGMVRASLGVYSTRDDVDQLASALTELTRNTEQITAAYTARMDGTYAKKSGADLGRVYSI